MSCKLKTVVLFLQIITNFLLSRPFGNIVYLLVKYRTIPLNFFAFAMVKAQFAFEQMNTLHGATVFHLLRSQPLSLTYNLSLPKKAPNIRDKKLNIEKQPASLALHIYKKGCFNIYIYRNTKT